MHFAGLMIDYSRMMLADWLVLSAGWMMNWFLICHRLVGDCCYSYELMGNESVNVFVAVAAVVDV